MTAFGKLAQRGNTVLLPANVGNPGSMIAQALSVFDSVRSSRKEATSRVEDDDGDAESGDADSGDDSKSLADAAAALSSDNFIPKPFK